MKLKIDIVISIISIIRVELISYIESILLGDPFQFLTNSPESRLAQKLPSCNVFTSCYQLSCVQRLFSFFGGRRFLLFADRLRNKKAEFHPNSSKKEKSEYGMRMGRQCWKNDLILSEQILEDSKVI